MLEGLRDVRRSLEKRGIQMVIQHTSPEQGVVQFAKGASFVVVDRGYLKIQRAWRDIRSQPDGLPSGSGRK